MNLKITQILDDKRNIEIKEERKCNTEGTKRKEKSREELMDEVRQAKTSHMMQRTENYVGTKFLCFEIYPLYCKIILNSNNKCSTEITNGSKFLTVNLPRKPR